MRRILIGPCMPISSSKFPMACSDFEALTKGQSCCVWAEAGGRGIRVQVGKGLALQHEEDATLG